MTTKLSQRRRTVGLHCPHFARMFEFERSRECAPMPPQVPRPSSNACSRNRPSPVASSTTRCCPAREAEFAPFPDWVDARIKAGLASRGISELYTHQAAAIDAVHAGQDVVVVTPTASGKTLCYAVPVLQAITEDAGVPGAVPVPDQGTRPGPGRRADGADEGGRARGCRGNVRRRHPGADPVGNPDRGPGRRHEPGHAQLGDPAPPHQVVPAVRAAEGDRRRRAPHVPGRFRQPRRERPAAAASRSAPTTAAGR